VIGASLFSLVWAGINVLRVKSVKMTADVVQVGLLSEDELEELKQR